MKRTMRPSSIEVDPSPADGDLTFAPPGGPPAASSGAGSGDRHGRQADREYAGTGVVGGMLLAFLVGALVVLLVAQNTDRVDFDLLWWSASVPLAVLLLIAALGAVVLAEVIGWIWRRRRRKLLQLTHR